MMAHPFSALLVGEASLLVQCGQLLRERGHTVVAVVSRDGGVTDWAHRHSIPVVPSVDDIVGLAERHPYDYLFSIANLQMLPRRVCETAARGAINFHDGPLPDYAGLHCTTWALLNREPTHGVTWHEMTERADTGPILVQERFPVSARETAFTLNARCFEVGVATFRRLVDGLESNSLIPHPQGSHERRYFGRRARPVAMGLIDWSQPADAIDALVRALDFGPYTNPLCCPKVIAPDASAFCVLETEVLEASSGLDAGTIVRVEERGFVVATATRDIRVVRAVGAEGRPHTGRASDGLQAGTRLRSLPETLQRRATQLHEEICTAERFWATRLERLQPYTLPFIDANPPAPTGTRAKLLLRVPGDLLRTIEAAGHEPRVIVTCATLGYLGLVADMSEVHVAFDTPGLHETTAGLEALCAMSVPLILPIDPQGSLSSLADVLAHELATLDRQRTYLLDLPARVPGLTARLPSRTPRFPVSLTWRADLDLPGDRPDADLRFSIAPDGSEIAVDLDSVSVEEEAARAMLDGLSTFLASTAEDPGRPLRLHPLSPPAPLADDRRTDGLTAHVRLHELIDAQVDRTPDAPAVVCRGQLLTYRELNRRANQIAHHLRAMGAGPGVLVGLCAARSTQMLVGLLGILKAGAAYVPLDPDYPTDRLALMIDDARMPILLADQVGRRALPTSPAQLLLIDTDWPTIAAQPTHTPEPLGTADDLAYVIFTSGSTGRPKGVMVSHANVANYFAGVDRIVGTAPGVWLAVTSISFDISVQELFWPLTHGFEVVIYTGDDRRMASRADGRRSHPTLPADGNDRPIDFSLFYFASDAAAQGKETYRLLLEGARFADQHGFSAVWTPERHFHAFGGLYPNPSVASAALATITSRVKLRAGSVVSPLHSPIRIAEEWALVDNLSGGRVGISFAAGWQANDFVLTSQPYADRKNLMLRDIEVVRRLWRGESVEFVNGVGERVPIRILPKPVQQELPVWVTAAGNPDTFRVAGEIGAYMLTHLLGQHLDELAGKIAIYRRAWRDAGHAGDGHVTLMLHTFVGDDTDAVREIVRQPFSEYLKTAVDLIKNAPAQFPTHKPPSGVMAAHLHKGMQEVSNEDLAALLEFAFERYFETSGLFGSVERCLEIVEDVRAIGTDEIGCLIDFGVHPALVLPSLRHLDAVRQRAQHSRPSAPTEETAAGLIERHRVTHLQCTPSLMRLLLSDERAASSVGRLKVLMLGGEALPPALADEVATLVHGRVHNMYGPTETTIWSTTAPVTGRGQPVTIGRPLVNQSAFVTNQFQQPLPLGMPGELCIGGDGVVHGYWDRPDLTNERFTTLAATRHRVYRTGDLARWRPDGQLEFLGRLDHQVKIRGYRVELGEIETVLAQHPSVSQAVVISREDSPGDQRLVAYVIASAGHPVLASEMRAFLQGKLPDFMVPATYISLPALPLTPNGKIDRRALPAPDRVRPSAQPATSEPRHEGSDLERTVASVLAASLNVDRVALQDNFFDLGAHSLLMVQVHSQLQEVLGRRFPLIHLFRFPTVAALAAALSQSEDSAREAPGDTRADLRRASVSRRQQIRRQLTQR